jgi:outer membrane protein assembly factor BamA
MNRRHPCLVLAFCISAIPAFAQHPASTRAAASEAERQAKAARLTVYQPGKVERFLTRLENGAMNRLFAPADGFGVRIGGIESGAGLALGPSWRSSSLSGGNLHLSASGARSIGGDTGIDAGLFIPHVGTHRLSLGLDASATRLPQERFFGTGLDTERANETAYGVNRDQIVSRATFAATEWLRLSASGGVLNTESLGGRARIVPSIDTRFTADDAPGLGQSARFSIVSLAATIDYRDVPMNPRGGGRYHVAVSRYADRSLNRYSFTRVDTEVEQHLSGWKRQRLLTLRAIAAATIADPGHDVPFYLQPTLGGSRVLRGFVTDRFRDANILAVQAEYGWDVLPFLNAVAFVEAGTTAPRWQGLSARDIRKDYGIGFRFGSARTVAFRTDVALGSGEGTRLTMRFNHAF